MKEHDNKKKPPCLAFLIPFAPRQAKSNWKIASEHLRQTLRSVQNSACGDFCVVVAGHDAPDFDVETDDRFRFLSLTHALPEHPRRGVAVRLDKLAKISAAWEYAKANWQPRYVMKLDSDDFISAQLVGWLAKADGPGYLLQEGWLWRDGACYFIQKTETLDRVCGSCLVIRSDLCDRTGPFLTEVEGVELTPENSQFAMLDHYALVPGSGTSTLLLNDSHQRYAAQFAYLGYALPALPFAGVVYRDRNADSITGRTGDGGPRFSFRMKLGALRRMRLITNSLKREFALHPEDTRCGLDQQAGVPNFELPPR